MCLTHDYVQHWFEHHALSRATPTLEKAAREWISDAEHARPGFATRLRDVAIAALAGPDPGMVRRALVALAVVAEPGDVALVTPLCESPDVSIAVEARTTRFVITHGAD